MRGTPAPTAESLRTRGLIPTYAGNTQDKGYIQVISRAHPHVCGEHIVDVIKGVIDWGSSPRMRGTLAANQEAEILDGLIPTYAGNTT